MQSLTPCFRFGSLSVRVDDPMAAILPQVLGTGCLSWHSFCPAGHTYSSFWLTFSSLIRSQLHAFSFCFVCLLVCFASCLLCGLFVCLFFMLSFLCKVSCVKESMVRSGVRPHVFNSLFPGLFKISYVQQAVSLSIRPQCTSTD